MLLAHFKKIDWDSRAVGVWKNLADDAWKTRVEIENRLIALWPKAVAPLVAAASGRATP